MNSEDDIRKFLECFPNYPKENCAFSRIGVNQETFCPKGTTVAGDLSKHLVVQETERGARSLGLFLYLISRCFDSFGGILRKTFDSLTQEHLDTPNKTSPDIASNSSHVKLNSSISATFGFGIRRGNTPSQQRSQDQPKVASMKRLLTAVGKFADSKRLDAVLYAAKEYEAT